MVMLLQFSVSNYRSIKDTITFSMLSSSKNENSFKIKLFIYDLYIFFLRIKEI